VSARPLRGEDRAGGVSRRVQGGRSDVDAAHDETLVAFVPVSGPRHGRLAATVGGDGLRWHLVKRSDAAGSDLEIWAATASSVLPDATVTSSLARPGSVQHASVRQCPQKGQEAIRLADFASSPSYRGLTSWWS